MRFVKAIVIDYKTTRNLQTKSGKQFNLHEFIAHETDAHGARIPISLTTANEKVLQFLKNLKGNETLIPFSKIAQFNNQDVFTIDESILDLASSSSTTKQN